MVALEDGLEVRSGHELLSGSLPIQGLRPCPEPGGPQICPAAPETLAFLTTTTGSWAAVLDGSPCELPWIELGTQVIAATLGRVSTASQWRVRAA